MDLRHSEQFIKDATRYGIRQTEVGGFNYIEKGGADVVNAFSLLSIAISLYDIADTLRVLNAKQKESS